MSPSDPSGLPEPRKAGSFSRPPSDRRRLHGAIAHQIALDIVSGAYPPRSVLPNEDDFSRALDVSRSAYREAIRILSAKGLVESRPKAGTRITDRSQWNLVDPDVLAWHFEAGPPERYVQHLFELRRIIEPRCAALAAERRTEADLERMRTSLALMARHTLHVPDGAVADLAFHQAVIEATRNEALISLSPGISTTIKWVNLIKYGRTTDSLKRDPIPDHTAVYEAIRDRDVAAAEQAMDHLVRLARDDLDSVRSPADAGTLPDAPG
ncbi:MAG: FadR/GntR family transcriptional regulator [Ancalomicrobiaceae bacterium]|nr:FadR/GntR family transcriptional regulator [Ancalomicrobiaceae bacterium]